MGAAGAATAAGRSPGLGARDRHLSPRRDRQDDAARVLVGDPGGRLRAGPDRRRRARAVAVHGRHGLAVLVARRLHQVLGRALLPADPALGREHGNRDHRRAGVLPERARHRSAARGDALAEDREPGDRAAPAHVGPGAGDASTRHLYVRLAQVPRPVGEQAAAHEPSGRPCIEASLMRVRDTAASGCSPWRAAREPGIPARSERRSLSSLSTSAPASRRTRR